MHRVEMFFAVQIAASGYAIWRGGAPERLVGSALLLALVATRALRGGVAGRFVGVEVGAMMVDCTLLGILVAIALHADRFWPAWATALHAMGTGAHLAKAISPDMIRIAYAILGALWSYPIIALLVIGTLRHSRRLRTHGRDLDWSRQDPGLR